MQRAKRFLFENDALRTFCFSANKGPQWVIIEILALLMARHSVNCPGSMFGCVYGLLYMFRTRYCMMFDIDEYC